METKANRWQLVLMFLIMMGNTLYILGGIYYIYLNSWIKMKKPETSYSLIFLMLNFMDLGIPITNYLFAILIPLIGIKCVLFLGGGVFYLSCLCFYYGYNFLLLFLANILAGMAHQVYVVSLLEILTRKYPTKYIDYVGKIFSAFTFSRPLWTLLAVLLVNPSNQPTSEFSIINGQREYYFAPDITKNFPRMIWSLAILGVFTACVLGLFLDDPSFRQSKLYCLFFNKHRSSDNLTSELSEDLNVSNSEIGNQTDLRPISNFRAGITFQSVYLPDNHLQYRKTGKRFRSVGSEPQNLNTHIFLKEVTYLFILLVSLYYFNSLPNISIMHVLLYISSRFFSMK